MVFNKLGSREREKHTRSRSQTKGHKIYVFLNQFSSFSSPFRRRRKEKKRRHNIYVNQFSSHFLQTKKKRRRKRRKLVQKKKTGSLKYVPFVLRPVFVCMCVSLSLSFPISTTFVQLGLHICFINCVVMKSRCSCSASRARVCLSILHFHLYIFLGVGGVASKGWGGGGGGGRWMEFNKLGLHECFHWTHFCSDLFNLTPSSGRATNDSLTFPALSMQSIS